MLAVILLFGFVITCGAGQEANNNEACGNPTNIYYYYSKDVNPIAGPSIQPPADVLQGRPGKVGPRGFKGDRGVQGEPGVSDNSVVDLLRSELANLTAKVVEVKEENIEMAEEFRRQLNESRQQVARLTKQLVEVENKNNETAEEFQRQLNESRQQVARLTKQLVEVENQNNETTEEFRRQLIRITNTTGKITNDCNDIIITSGVYYERTTLNPVYCEEESNGGNWLVFQRRVDGSVDFYRNWTEYQRGFGNVEGNYWLGLDALHTITSSRSYQLRVDLEDWENNSAYALYSSFSVDDESSNYRLSVSGYSGNARDSLAYHNNRPFSTKDNDNDLISGNCAVGHRGGYWYRSCTGSNLNGEYQGERISSSSVYWYTWKDSYYSLKRSVMKIRPN